MDNTKNVVDSDREEISMSLIDQAMYTYPAALRAAAVLKVADRLADGPRTAEELAAATEVDVSD